MYRFLLAFSESNHITSSLLDRVTKFVSIPKEAYDKLVAGGWPVVPYTYPPGKLTAPQTEAIPAFGSVLPIIGIAAIAYAFLGPYIPGALRGPRGWGQFKFGKVGQLKFGIT